MTVWRISIDEICEMSFGDPIYRVAETYHRQVIYVDIGVFVLFFKI